MSNLKEHRIYKYMSEPFRFAGLTVDEMTLAFASFFLFFLVDTALWKAFWMGLGPVGVVVIKKFKKLATGFSLTSFLDWHLGLRLGVSRHWPESWKRKWRA